MAWIERIDLRARTTKTWQDGKRYALASIVSAPVHYGNENAPVDMRPVRVNNAQLDGWRVNSADWNYAIGQPSGKGDGWVGFGKLGHWFQFRLERMGYLHHPTRNYEDIGGIVNYSRAGISTSESPITLGPVGAEKTVYAETAVMWSGLWSTPGGGDVSIRWKLDGQKLKEDVIVNQIGRDWITANAPPTTPPAQTYFVFVYEVDWSDVPQRIINSVAQNANADFSDDTGGVELRTALDELIAFMPIDDLYVVNGGEVVAQTPLRKRFYTVGGVSYLAVGVRLDALAGLPVGDLVFDPTISAQVSTGNDDFTWREGNSSFDNAASEIAVGDRTSVGWGNENIGFRVDMTGPANGVTIDVATITLRARGNTSGTTVNATISAVDASSPAAPTTYSGAESATRTAASVAWNNIGSWTNDTDITPPSIVSVIQELVDSYTIGYVIIYIEDNGSSDDARRVAYTYDVSTSRAPKLYIEWSSAISGANKRPFAMNHGMSRRLSKA